MPPAVVAFLLGDCRWSAEVVTRVLLELADEGVLRFGPRAGGAPAISLTAEPQSGRSLLLFEQIMLERISIRAAGRTGVPLPVLISDDGDDFTNWRRRLTDAIGWEAEQAGMSRNWPGKIVVRMALVLTPAIMAATIVAHQVGRTAAHVMLPIAVCAVPSLLAILFAMTRWRLTPLGAEAAERWRRAGLAAAGLQDRRPDGVPLLPAPAASAIGPRGDPLPRGQAWSSFGGHWHPVKVGRQHRSPKWSTTRTLAVLLGYLVLGTGYGAAVGLIGVGGMLGKLIVVIPGAVGGTVILGFWLPAYARRMRLPETVTFDGEVIKRWKLTAEDGPDRHLVCIDDGWSAAGLAVQVPAAAYPQLNPGRTVRVTFSPRHRRLVDIHASADPALTAGTPAPWREDAKPRP